jgi:hypothetical protein
MEEASTEDGKEKEMKIKQHDEMKYEMLLCAL